MKRMKKLFCYLLALCLVLTLVPGTAYAAGTEQKEMFSEADFENMRKEQQEWLEECRNRNAFDRESMELNALPQRASKASKARSVAAVSYLKIGDVNALETSEGEGWSFDAETGTLTLSGAEITGDESSTYGNAIYAEGDLTIIGEGTSVNSLKGMYTIDVRGNLTIKDCLLDVEGVVCAFYVTGTMTVENSTVSAEQTMTYEEALSAQPDLMPPYAIMVHGDFTANDSEVNASGVIGCSTNGNYIVNNSTVNVIGELEAIWSNGAADISNSKVTAKATLPMLGDEVLFTPYPPSGIWADTISITDNSEVACDSTYAGLYSFGEVDILDSTVEIETVYYGIYAEAPINIERSNLTTNDNVSLEEICSGSLSPLTAGIEGPCVELSAVDSEINISSLLAGIDVYGNESSGSKIAMENCTLDIEAGALGIWANEAIDFDNTTTNIQVTMSLEDVVNYMNLTESALITHGIAMNGEESSLNMYQSPISIEGGYNGIAVQNVTMKESDSIIESDAVGIIGNKSVMIDSCAKTQIYTDAEMAWEYYKDTELFMGSDGIQSSNGVTIKGKDSVVDISGGLYAIRGGTDVMIDSCDANLSSAIYGVYATTLEIVNSDAEIETTITEEQKVEWGIEDKDVHALHVTELLTLTDCKITSKGTSGLYETEDTSYYTILDDSGLPVKSATIERGNKTPENPFTDVNANDWFYDSTQYVYQKGLMSGHENKFSPDDSMTRAMMVTTLYRMIGSPEVTDYTASNIFSDVEKGSWYEDAVNWAYNEGVTTGYPELQLFGSNDNVTREQLAVFLYRYANKQGLDVTKRGDVTSLKNHDKTSDYATEGISWAVGTGLISGVQLEENGVTVYDLAPQGSATRAQLATILMRFCEYYDL